VSGPGPVLSAGKGDRAAKASGFAKKQTLTI